MEWTPSLGTALFLTFTQGKEGTETSSPRGRQWLISTKGSPHHLCLQLLLHRALPRQSRTSWEKPQPACLPACRSKHTSREHTEAACKCPVVPQSRVQPSNRSSGPRGQGPTHILPRCPSSTQEKQPGCCGPFQPHHRSGETVQD